MTNFTDFLTVAKEAQKNIELMKEKTKIVNTEIANIQESRYEAFRKFWYDVADVLRELKTTNTQWTFRVPIMFRGDKDIYMKIYVDRTGIQLGTYMGSKDDFRRWVSIVDNYDKFMYETRKDPVIHEIMSELINDWSEWESKFEVAIKDFITEYMAFKIKDTHDQYNKACTKLFNI